MLKKSIPCLIALLAPALLTGCPVYVDTLGGYPSYGSPDVMVVGADVPADIEYGQPTYTQGRGDGNPLIDSFTQNISQVKQGQPVTFTVVAHDPNKRPLQFNWSATGGTLSANTGRVVSWDPPENAGIYTVTVVISNGNGGVVSGALNLTVHPGANPTPAPATPSPVIMPYPVPVNPMPTGVPSPVIIYPSVAPSVVPTPTPTPAPTATPAPQSTPTPPPVVVQDPTKSAISGVVKDSQGALAGVDMVLTSSDANVPFVATVTTGADGSYRFVNVPADINLVVSARKDGYGQKLRTVATVHGQEANINFTDSFALVRN